uniref:Uncharacterized protein n=1 Tax=Sphenodon punctatus TaxID=8508 RepID=A0A8D0GKA1_SPHPU
MYHLSRKFLEWAYGPVQCSFYDLSEVDTGESHSALKIVVYNTSHERHDDMLDVEPLKELLDIKWRSFAAAMFGLSMTLYLSYLIFFTVITTYQPHPNQQDTVPNNTVEAVDFSKIEDRTWWIFMGQIYIFLVAVGLMIKTGLEIIWMWPLSLRSFIQNNYFHALL